MDVLEHFAAEHVVEGRWVLQTPGLRNEAFDLAYYLGAACDAKGIRALTMEHLRITLTTAPTADQIKAWGVRHGESSAAPVYAEAVKENKPVRKPAPTPVGVNGSARIAAVRAAMARRRR
jgi:phage terminase large subunit GpA-like protein